MKDNSGGVGRRGRSLLVYDSMLLLVRTSNDNTGSAKRTNKRAPELIDDPAEEGANGAESMPTLSLPTEESDIALA